MTETRCDRCGAAGAIAFIAGERSEERRLEFAQIGQTTYCTGPHCDGLAFKGDLCQKCITELVAWFQAGKEKRT